jgi:hypothetical protein
MYAEPEDMIRRLQHEKNVWRGIAIGLGSTLLLLLVLAAVFSLTLLRQSRAQAMRAEAAMMQAEQERQRAEEAQREAVEQQRRAVRKKAAAP